MKRKATHNPSSIYLRGQLKYNANLYADAKADFDSVLAKQANFHEAYIDKRLSLLK